MSNACLGGSVIVEVTDQCPCAGNERWCCGDKVHFDMSPEAFSRIANTGAGVINTQFRPVTCPVSVRAHTPHHTHDRTTRHTRTTAHTRSHTG
jgi:rare lipoprotein A (peptidoglycan hydrolase)